MSEFYEVLGKVKSGKLKPLNVPLPEWAKNNVCFPKDIDVISNCDEYNIDSLSPILNKHIIKKLHEKNITKFFPVQKKLIPTIIASLKNKHLFRPRDLCISSPTGSGKTMAFVIPLIQHLLKRVSTEIRAIVVLPVRDLAHQVYKVIEEFIEGTNLNACLTVGHRSFQEDVNSIVKKDEDGSFRTLIDILVTTPSRILSLIDDCPGFSLKFLEILIIDEVDRIMDFEYEYNWYREIENFFYGRNNVLPCYCSYQLAKQDGKCLISNICGCYLTNYNKKTQSYIKLLFSATLAKDIHNLHALNLFQPQFFFASDDARITKVVSKDLIPEKLIEKFILIDLDKKPLVMWYLIEKLNLRKILCFTAKKKHSKRLYNLLKNINGLGVYEFSSLLPDRERDSLIKKFNDGDFDVIIATDIMTRGIDINGIKYVISYDKPHDEIQYVHRIGRTARAGQEGTAITLLTESELKSFFIILRKVHTKEEINEKIEKMVIRNKQLKSVNSRYLSAFEKLTKKAKKDERKLNIFKKSLPWNGITGEYKNKKRKQVKNKKK